jgi:predicted deacylase
MIYTLECGSVSVPTNSIRKGFLSVAELADGMSEVKAPVWVMNGVGDGPIIYLQSGAHGQEAGYSFEALRQVFLTVDASRLHGAIIAVPIANPLALLAACRLSPQYAAREGIAFAGDLHKVWTGDPQGSLTQRIAAVLWNTVVGLANYVIDYHAVSVPGMPFTFLYRGGTSDALNTEVWEQSLKLAGVFSLTIIETKPNPLTLCGASLDAGKPAIMVELPVARIADDVAVQITVRGTLNVLRHLGMIEGAQEPQTGFPFVSGVRRALPSIRAQRGGMISFMAPCGVALPAGTTIAKIHDAMGDLVECVVIPEDGYVMTYPAMSWVGTPSVSSGDYVADLFR